MKYNSQNKSLYSKNGRLIKNFDCPLNKELGHLSFTNNDLIRYCGSCSKNVIDITSFNENQIIAIFKISPESCAYIDFKQALEVIEVESDIFPDRCDNNTSITNRTVIQTARGLDAINNAIREGFTLDIVATDVQGGYTTHSTLDT